MRMFLKKCAATSIALCLVGWWPGAAVRAVEAAAAEGGGQAELDSLLEPAHGKRVVLEGLSVDGDRLTLTFNSAVKDVMYRTNLLPSPPRLVIDLMNTDYQVGAYSVPAKGKFFQRVRGRQYKKEPEMVSRVVVDMTEASPWHVSPTGKDLVVSLLPMDAGMETASAAPAATPLPAASEEAAEPEVAATPVKAAAPKAAAAPVVAAAPVAAEASPARPTVSAVSPTIVTASAPRRAVVRAEVQEKAAVAKAKDVRKGDIMANLPKHNVSLNFDNTSIGDILTLMAVKAKVNIIRGPAVTGTLSLTLKDVPFDEAFRTVLQMMGLTTMQVGNNILRVLTPEALVLERSNATGVTRIVSIQYAKAADLLKAVNDVRAAEGRTTGNALADEVTNSLIITDSLEGLSSTMRLIEQLDIIPQQVLIEAKMVEVALNNNVHFGIQWDYFQMERGEAFGKQGVTSIGAPMGIQTNTSELQANTPTSGNLFPGDRDTNYRGIDQISASGVKPPLTSGRNFGVNLPASSVLGALTIGRISNNWLLNATLSAAAGSGKLKVLSDPKITTLNNKVAEINVTTQIPYDISNVSDSGTVSRNVAYAQTGIVLKVTPIISAETNRITLDINPSVSQAGATSGSVSGAPVVDAREAKTTVIVKDGETIVIGGLISDREEKIIAKIPLLGDIPILGWLFKKKSVTRTRGELLIFVTPRIIKDV